MKVDAAKKRVLIFVIAYHAEATLRSVLERIPRSVFSTYDCEILIVDDASADRTFSIGQEYRAAHPAIAMTVLRNEYNQGYGGNQKVGYAYAIAEGFDFVAMVHGDGQYAPEELPRLLEPLRAGKADAVFGSRMMEGFAALRGGMPLYKFLGNKILTTLQNGLLGSNLSEFHSGYRIYSTRILDAVPFALNSNDFHFDTEVIIQLLNARARLLELPIPTFYGDEISRVNGLKYAANIMRATVKNVAHRRGIFYQRKFDVPKSDPTPDLKLGYLSSHTLAMAEIPSGAKVLVIGDDAVAIAEELLKKGCIVAAVCPRETNQGSTGIELHAQDLNSALTFDVKPYDYILLLDVVAQVRNPEEFLSDLREQFDHKPRKVIITVPNVAFFVERVMLSLFGQFNYGKAGILDQSHTRLFTFRTLRYLLQDNGFRIKRMSGIPAPFPKVFSGSMGNIATHVNTALIAISKTVFAYQIFVVAETTPGVAFLLRNAKEKSGSPTDEPNESRGPTKGTSGTRKPAKPSIYRN